MKIYRVKNRNGAKVFVMEPGNHLQENHTLDFDRVVEIGLPLRPNSGYVEYISPASGDTMESMYVLYNDLEPVA